MVRVMSKDGDNTFFCFEYFNLEEVQNITDKNFGKGEFKVYHVMDTEVDLGP